MLRIYPVILDMLRALRPLLTRLQHHDADLARQMRRACSSVALNVAEGCYSRGQNRTARYHNALGSMRETLACVEVAEALGYIPEIDARLRRDADVIIGTVVKLVWPN